MGSLEEGDDLGEGSSLLLRQTLKELTVGGCLHYVLFGRHVKVLPTFQGRTCSGYSQQTTLFVPVFSFEKLMAGITK